MAYQKGHKFHRSSKPGAYVRGAVAKHELYEPLPFEEIPTGIQWKPSPPFRGGTRAFISAFGGLYKLIRTLDTGEVTYFKLKGESPSATPKEKIDAEPPEREKQQRFRTGAHVWYVDDAGRWFCCEVVARTGRDRATFGETRSITLRPVTGWDAEKHTAWPFGDGPVEISFKSQAFKRIFKLNARKP